MKSKNRLPTRSEFVLSAFNGAEDTPSVRDEDLQVPSSDESLVLREILYCRQVLLPIGFLTQIPRSKD